jgi:hypothetical protein
MSLQIELFRVRRATRARDRGVGTNENCTNHTPAGVEVFLVNPRPVR